MTADTPQAPQSCSIVKDTITIDGCPDDWLAMDIKPLIVDARGDAVSADIDLLNVSVTNDKEFFYLLMEFASPPAGNPLLLFNTDQDRSTGCGLELGVEFGISFDPERPEFTFIGDARDCTIESSDFPDALTYAIRGNFIEAAVPLKTIAAFGAVREIEIFCKNNSCEPARYTLQTSPEAVVVGGTLTGLKPIVLGQFMALCYNISTGEHMTVLVESPEWDCRKLGLKFSSGDMVATGAAGVVSEQEVETPTP